MLLLEDDMQTSRLHYYARATMNEDTPEIMAKNRLPWRSVDDAIVYFNAAATQVSLTWNLSPCKTTLRVLRTTEKNIARED